MFGEPGHAYVYFTYGMHFCVNLVCLPEGDRVRGAAAGRAGSIEGVPLATGARGPPGGRAGAHAPSGTWPGGPARLCQALGIDRAQDGADVCDPGSPLRVPARAGRPPGQLAPRRSAAGPRVGVSAAADRPWRFWLDRRPDRLGVPPARAAPGPGRKPVSPPAGEDGTMHR